LTVEDVNIYYWLLVIFHCWQIGCLFFS